MKKAYVRTKTPSAKTVLKRPYIAATIISAAICAIVLSVAVGEPDKNVPEEILIEETKSAAKPTITPIEVPEPSTENEVVVPSEEEVYEAVEESVNVGLFGDGGDLKMIRPADGEILKDYSDGKPVKSKTMGDWRAHNGIDIKADVGTDVRASASGEVLEAYTDNLTGATIKISHGHGVVSTVYNLENCESVAVGQKVKEGDVIGKVGSSAKIELLEESHIHFEITKDGEIQDPKNYFK